MTYTPLLQWEHSFIDHVKSSQADLLKEVGKGQMTPEIEESFKKVVPAHVESFLSS